MNSRKYSTTVAIEISLVPAVILARLFTSGSAVQDLPEESTPATQDDRDGQPKELAETVFNALFAIAVASALVGISVPAFLIPTMTPAVGSLFLVPGMLIISHCVGWGVGERVSRYGLSTAVITKETDLFPLVLLHGSVSWATFSLMFVLT